MFRYLLYVWVLTCLMFLGACGGGGSSGGFSNNGNTNTAANAMTVTVDSGASLLNNAGYYSVNSLFASITVCTPGSTTACQTVDHVLVDTGSIGVQLVSEALGTPSTAAPTPKLDPTSGVPYRKCVQFADGYVWGSLRSADVKIGNRWLYNFPINIIGDPYVEPVPSTCTTIKKGTTTITLPSENTVVDFGANGVLGIGNFLQDCGTYCESNAPDAGYYVCPSSPCTPTKITVGDQLQNPIGALTDGDNNGVVIDLPAVSNPGATSLVGTMYFGVDTQTNNASNGASIYPVDSQGKLITVYNNTTLSQSFIDSGSSLLFFDDNSLTPIPTCTDANTTYTYGLYCPGGNTATSANYVQKSATIEGAVGSTAAAIDFKVGNAYYLYNYITNNQRLTVIPTLAEPISAVAAPFTSAFDWGLPFFYGRKVYVLFENDTNGPAMGF